MKILWIGNVFNPTGIATANREILKELSKIAQVQVIDPWNEDYDCNKDLAHLNNAIGVDKETRTIYADYPQNWLYGKGKKYSFFLHEGTRLLPGWAERFNLMEKVFVPSNATKNLFLWNNVVKPIEVIPYGVSELYKPGEDSTDENYLFLSVNSWTGKANDRKGTDVLIKAFDEEFKPEEKVKLILKISTFWETTNQQMYMNSIMNLLGHYNENIIFNSNYTPESELVSYYQKSDCFVSPTKAESFGLTIINAMACGLPVICTRDNNSGYMDFCKDTDSVLFIETKGMEQGDRRFYAEGNMQPVIDKESLKKQMRYAFEHRKELRAKSLIISDWIRTMYLWKNTAKQLLEALK